MMEHCNNCPHAEIMLLSLDVKHNWKNQPTSWWVKMPSNHKNTTTLLTKSTVCYLRAPLKPEQHNGLSVIKTCFHKNMRAHTLMFDLHSCWVDKINLINEYESVVKPDSSITESISQLPCLGCERLYLTGKQHGISTNKDLCKISCRWKMQNAYSMLLRYIKCLGLIFSTIWRELWSFLDIFGTFGAFMCNLFAFCVKTDKTKLDTLLVESLFRFIQIFRKVEKTVLYVAVK